MFVSTSHEGVIIEQHKHKRIQSIAHSMRIEKKSDPSGEVTAASCTMWCESACACMCTCMCMCMCSGRKSDDGMDSSYLGPVMLVD